MLLSAFVTMFRCFGTWLLVFYTLLLSSATPINAQFGGGEFDDGNLVESGDHQGAYDYGGSYDENPDNDDPCFNFEDPDNDDLSCNQHGGKSEDCDKCHHNTFKSMPKIIKETYGEDVRVCCNENNKDGYIFKDTCRVCKDYWSVIPRHDEITF